MKTLERRLGLAGVLAISLSAMLGSGLFVLPGLAAAKTGPSVWLAYIVAGLCVLPAALSKSELATAMPTSGGTYVYLDRTFGPLAGTISGLGLWLSLLLKSAFALVGFGAYLAVIVSLPLKATALCLLCGVVVINIVGVRAVSTVQKGVVMIVLIVLTALVIGGAWSYDPALLAPAFTDGTGGFLAATGFVYVSYAGVTKVAAIAEEVKAPHRNLPRGIILSLLIAMTIYGIVVHMLVALVPASELATDLHPIYTLAHAVGGSTVGTVAAVLGVVTMTSMATAGLLASSRFPFAMSRDHLLPDSLHRVHPRFLTPVLAIVITGVLMGVAIMLLDVQRIAKLASGFKIMIFMGVNGAVIVLRESNPQWYKPGYRAPLYPLLQIVGILLGFVLLFVMGLTALIAALGIAVPGTIFYFLYGRQRTKRLGVLRKLGRRTDLIRVREEPMPDIEAALPGAASVVVPLFGTETSPESLVEVALAMADGRKVEVLFLTEVLDQMGMDDALEMGTQAASIKRRIEAMAEATGADIEFDAVLSRDVVRTIHSVAGRVHCDWVVMESAGRASRGIGVQNPIGWLQDHLPCNLAVFKDAGVRYVRQIMVFAEPGPHDALVVRTADHLAHRHGAELHFVSFVKAGASAREQQASAGYVDQLRRIATAPSDARVLHGRDPIEAVTRETAAHDLLVTGAPPDRTLLRMIFGTGKDRLTRFSACSVLWLKRARRMDDAAPPHVDETAERDVLSCLHRDCFGARLRLQKKDEVMNRIAIDFASALDDADPTTVAAALWERERVQNTALGMGVAIPHASWPEASRSLLGVYTLAEPLDYGSPDGQEVDILFVTIGPPDDRHAHLEVLAAVSKMSLHTDLLARLRDAETAADIERAVRHCAQSI